jgi:hypothetical protein
MDNIKTVDELIRAKHMSEEELELHEELIEECLDRETKIARCRAETEQNIREFAHAALAMSATTVELGKALQALVEETDSLYLRLLPQDRFFRE